WLVLAYALVVTSQAIGRENQWGAYNVIDVHGHIGHFRGFDLTVPTLLENIKRWQVKYVLISNINGAALYAITADIDETAKNRETEGCVRAHSDCLRGLLWARPEDGNPANLEPFAAMKIANTN